MLELSSEWREETSSLSQSEFAVARLPRHRSRDLELRPFLGRDENDGRGSLGVGKYGTESPRGGGR